MVIPRGVTSLSVEILASLLEPVTLPRAGPSVGGQLTQPGLPRLFGTALQKYLDFRFRDARLLR